MARREARASPGEAILELAAGIGETGFIAAKLLGSQERLLTADFAPAMVEGARRRAGHRRGGRDRARTAIEAEVAPFCSEQEIALPGVTLNVLASKPVG